jgi:hypothetical protein
LLHDHALSSWNISLISLMPSSNLSGLAKVAFGST